ncbi:MAG: hypothetical protein K0Q49_816 [Haloplasmataceae bacterium]|jgi:hypothetical protein|nr:hypothetical protein [Haloplasmataceae bacterium]
MEKKLLKYTLIVIIFFVGLSLGVSYQDNNKTRDIQQSVDDWEDDNTIPTTGTNDDDEFTPVDPAGSSAVTKKVNHNLFSSLAKDGEFLIKKGLDLILSKSDDLIKFVFGKK